MSFARTFQENPKVICVDMDDVLLHLREGWVSRHKEFYGEERKIEELQWFDCYRSDGWGKDFDEMAKIINTMIEDTRNDWSNVKEVPGAKEALETLKGMGYRLILVTHRDPPDEPMARKWLAEKYPGVFDELRFAGGHFYQIPNIPAIPKAEICREVKARLLIDDCLETAMKCSQEDPPIPVIVFGNYTWNRFGWQHTPQHEAWAKKKIADKDYWTGDHPGQELPETVKRARDWKEVIKIVKGSEEEAEGAGNASLRY